MQKSAIKVFVVFSFLFLLSLGFIGVPAEARSHQQQATSAIATVTGTPTGVIVRVTNEYEQINVRSGPGVANDISGGSVTYATGGAGNASSAGAANTGTNN